MIYLIYDSPRYYDFIISPLTEKQTNNPIFIKYFNLLNND